MRKHNGMRPQDVAILLKIAAVNDPAWRLVDIAHALHLSLSEISESLNRSRLAALIDDSKKNINRLNLLEFLEHGVRYVFPQRPGAQVRGLPTAHSHPSMKKVFVSKTNYVWPDAKGEVLGFMVEPFYAKQTEAARIDPLFYKLMALVDMIRVGRVREVKTSVLELKKILLHEPSH